MGKHVPTCIEHKIFNVKEKWWHANIISIWPQCVARRLNAKVKEPVANLAVIESEPFNNPTLQGQPKVKIKMNFEGKTSQKTSYEKSELPEETTVLSIDKINTDKSKGNASNNKDVNGYNSNYLVRTQGDIMYEEDYSMQRRMQNRQRGYLNSGNFIVDGQMTSVGEMNSNMIPTAMGPLFQIPDNTRPIQNFFNNPEINLAKQKRTPRPANAFIIYRKETQAEGPYNPPALLLEDMKAKAFFNAIGNDYSANNHFVYNLQNMPQSNILYNTPALKSLLNKENSRLSRNLNISDPAFHNQYAQNMSAIPQGIEYGQNPSYRNNLGFPMSETNSQPSRTIISPGSNKNMQGQGLNGFNSEMDLKRFSSATEPLINPVAPQQTTKMPSLYYENGAMDDYPFNAVSGNTNSQYIQQNIYSSTKSALDMFDNEVNRYNGFTNEVNYGPKQPKSLSFGNQHIISDNKMMFSESVMQQQKGYSVFKEPNPTNLEKKNQSQNVFSIPIDDFYRNNFEQ
ncbi:hypothetical protein BB560_003686 [Smittium megazygosporum]|uniref:Uncharacterized protein n=1 Tax=Smittium megazygosporum TaxID=133381 RepID=A0A2T9ZBC9_9FUNG|nr:hypothetical protein BB560_003686 [Smittium megazygosporum]